MRVSTIINTDFNSNTYVIDNSPVTNEVIIIDPGEEKEKLAAFLSHEGYKPLYIILTHEHFDHIAGINYIKDIFTDCKVVCSKPCADRIIDAKGNLSFYRNRPYATAAADIIIDEKGQLINWSEYTVNCMPWQGHSPGGMFLGINDVLFCGDQFLKDIKTVTNLPGSKKEKVKECFDYLKSNYPPQTTLYPGHGERFQLGQLVSF